MNAPIPPSPSANELLTRDGAAASTLWTLDPSYLHLNHGSYGALPAATAHAQTLLRQRMEAEPVSWFRDLPARIAAARTEVASRISAPADRLAFTFNASAAATIALANTPLRGRVVVTDHGYGAVRGAAQRWASRAAVDVETVAIPLEADDDELVGRLVERLNDGVGTLVIDQIASPTARMFPVAEIARHTRARGITLIVDGAHSPGLLDQPLAHDADIWIGNLHKWSCAPKGTAVIVVRDDATSLRPLIDSWGMDAPYPSAFDLQGSVDLTGWLTAPHAWDLIDDEWGWNTVRTHASELAHYGAALLAGALEDRFDYRASVRTNAQLPMRVIRLPQRAARTPEAIESLRNTILTECRSVTAITSLAGESFLRLSAHAYTTRTEIDTFVERVLPVIERHVIAA